MLIVNFVLDDTALHSIGCQSGLKTGGRGSVLKHWSS